VGGLPPAAATEGPTDPRGGAVSPTKDNSDSMSVCTCNMGRSGALKPLSMCAGRGTCSSYVLL
jgi:hypothetical protein